MFNEKRSDYSQMLQSLYSIHFNKNIGALVVIGDGSYNQGENPQNLIKKFSYPVFTFEIRRPSGMPSLRISG